MAHETLKLKRISEPKNLPLSLNEAKHLLRVDEETIDDALIMALLRAAVQRVESYTGRALITQSWRLSRDRWPARRAVPDHCFDGTGISTPRRDHDTFFEIPKPPLQAVSQFEIYDTADTVTSVATSVYFVDADSDPGRLALRFGQTWPTTTLRPVNGIAVSFLAGYGDSGDQVPSDIVEAIRLLLTHFYENRTCSVDDVAMPLRAMTLLNPYRIRTL